MKKKKKKFHAENQKYYVGLPNAGLPVAKWWNRELRLLLL
jgi:hypothetical protein